MPDPAGKARIIIVNIYVVFSICQHVLNLTFSHIVLFYPLSGPMRKLLLQSPCLMPSHGRLREVK